jgi:hypothetical protein
MNWDHAKLDAVLSKLESAAKGRGRADSEFDESKHPREADGRFGEGSSQPAAPKKPETKAGKQGYAAAKRGAKTFLNEYPPYDQRYKDYVEGYKAYHAEQRAKDPKSAGRTAGTSDKVNISGPISQEGVKTLEEALKDIPPLPAGTKIVMTPTDQGYWAVQKAGTIVITPSLMKQHPKFISAVIHHEAVHLGQDYRTMTTQQRESQAHSKTISWIHSQLAKEKDPKSIAALKKALSDANEDLSRRG